MFSSWMNDVLKIKAEIEVQKEKTGSFKLSIRLIIVAMSTMSFLWGKIVIEPTCNWVEISTSG